MCEPVVRVNPVDKLDAEVGLRDLVALRLEKGLEHSGGRVGGVELRKRRSDKQKLHIV